MDKKRSLPTFIEIESVIRPGVMRPRPAKAPEKRLKAETERKGVPVSRGSAKVR